METGSSFEPNPEAMSLLLSMGISENVAKEALFCTGNTSYNAAIDYIYQSKLEHNEVNGSPPKNAHSRPLSPEGVQDEEEDEWEDEDAAINYKMTFVVNGMLKMGVGKIAAQVGHASVGLYRTLLGKDMGAELNQWEEIGGEKKIVLKGTSAQQLLDLHDEAKHANIPAVYLVRDAGHTQIRSGSITVLGLFGLEENIDKITGKLSLL